MSIKISYFLNNIGEFWQGPYHDRLHVPKRELVELGFETETVFMQQQIPPEVYEGVDIAVFGRTYSNDPFPIIRRLKDKGTKIVYELDDDIWTVPEINPARTASRATREDTEKLIGEADLVIASTEYMKEVLEQFHDNVKICPNSVNPNQYRDIEEENKQFRIGWSGSVTHYDDLKLVLPALKELQEEHDFLFLLQGLSEAPLDAEIYKFRVQKKLTGVQSQFIDRALEIWDILQEMNWTHIPFRPPEQHTDILTNMNLDIGLCPLTDNDFNKAKSNMKFYQYAATGAATLASDVVPYNTEMKQLVENDHDEWKERIEELIVNDKKREEVTKEQKEWVMENRTVEKVVPTTWAKYFRELVKGRED